jgi:hypothetical protein
VTGFEELEPRGTFELVVELRFVEYELERLAGGLLATGQRVTAHACLADAATLGTIRGRLEAGQTTDELAGLFLAAAHTIRDRRLDELEAARA